MTGSVIHNCFLHSKGKYLKKNSGFLRVYCKEDLCEKYGEPLTSPVSLKATIIITIIIIIIIIVIVVTKNVIVTSLCRFPDCSTNFFETSQAYLLDP